MASTWPSRRPGCGPGGRNGSGKTTLSKLLCRLYDPTAGRITIDGVDLRSVRTDDLRREIGVIHQDFGRYQLSVRENVALGLRR